MAQRRTRSWLVVLTIVAGLALAACGGDNAPATSVPQGASTASAEMTAPPALSDVESAPELASIEGWHNTEPLTLAGMQGSTVLLVFFSDT